MEDYYMKRLLLIIAIIFASVQLKASHMASEFNLRFFDNSLFVVTVNNQVYGTPVTKFNLNNIVPGSHYLRVSKISHGHLGHYAQPLVVFSGYIDIPVRSRVNAAIDRQNRFRINKIVALAPAPMYYAPTPVYYAHPHHISYGMNENEFRQLKYTIDRLSFDSSRLQVASQAVSMNYFTTYQVAELMSLLTFESNKLDLAKRAYHKTVDKHNYYLINDQFTFESSITDLSNYIFRG